MKHFSRRAILWILIPVLCGVFLFRESIAVYAAPRFVLSKAISNTFSQLESRFSGSPAQVLAPCFDPTSRYQADFSLDTSSDLLGLLRWKMNIQTQGEPAQVLSSGHVTVGSQIIQLSLFANESFGAVSPQISTEGKYYGISYDSFSRDLQKNPLLSAMVGQETLSQWETLISGLHDTMSRSYIFPDISPEDLRTVMLGILTLDPKVSREEITSAGQTQRVHIISFHATGQEIASLASDYSGTFPQEIRNLINTLSADSSSAVRAEFCISGGKILRISGEMTCIGDKYRFSTDLGSVPSEDPLCFVFSSNSGGVDTSWSLTSELHKDAKLYREKLSIEKAAPGEKQQTILDYAWNAHTNEINMKLLKQGREHTLRFMLHPNPDGFTIQTDQFFQLLNVFCPTKNSAPAICTIAVSKGQNFPAPEYRDFSQWSMEDTLSLLSDFGTLLGLSSS